MSVGSCRGYVRRQGLLYLNVRIGDEHSRRKDSKEKEGGVEEEGKEGEAEGKYKKKKTNKGVFVSEVYITGDWVVLLLDRR